MTTMQEAYMNADLLRMHGRLRQAQNEIADLSAKLIEAQEKIAELQAALKNRAG